MIPRRDIDQFVADVVVRFEPSAVILFGSHACGTADADSDVDLMVVMPYRGSSAQAATRIRLACPRTFSMDLLVRTSVELSKGIEQGDPFLREVVSKGIVLHEAANARVG